MPELPEVETICRRLSKRLAGCMIDSVHLYRGDVLHGVAFPLCAAMCNHRIERVSRSGKQIRIDLSGPFALQIHLGMSGQLIAVDRSCSLARHTHLRIVFRQQPVELRFIDARRFGGVWLVGQHEHGDNDWIGRRLAPIGEDPLRLSSRRFAGLLSRRRQIKALLLDQSLLGGIGNIYCDEALHRAGIHPLTAADRLGARGISRLYRSLRAVLREAIRAGGSTISDYRTADNEPGTFQNRHRVYNRDGRPCRRCGHLIEKTVVAGRGTHFCPSCQPPKQARHEGI